jgi:hypothetical protein
MFKNKFTGNSEVFTDYELEVEIRFSRIISVASILATFHKLEYKYVDLTLASISGWSIAHELARISKLPDWFTNLELADSDGCTVAHILANFGKLPSWFKNLEISDINGLTISDCMLNYNLRINGEFKFRN